MNIVQKILACMIQESRWVTRLHHFLIIVRNLERIADLATNIAEDIVFIVEGRVIKHQMRRVDAGFDPHLTLAWANFSSRSCTSWARR